MSTNSFFAKFLRFIGIVLWRLTGGFTLLGGIGTTCAALPHQLRQYGRRWLPSNGCISCSCLVGIALGVMGDLAPRSCLSKVRTNPTR